MSECIFCNIVNGKIPSKPVYQDDHCIVIHDLHPQAPVHLLVIPKKHVVDIMDMTKDEYYRFMQTIRDVITRQGVRKFRLVHNGKGAQFIPHAHVHIMGQISADRNL
jgi:histidine triad (HIT) family protein